MKKKPKFVSEMTAKEKKEHNSKNRNPSFRPGCMFESDKYDHRKSAKAATSEAWDEHQEEDDEES